MVLLLTPKRVKIPIRTMEMGARVLAWLRAVGHVMEQFLVFVQRHAMTEKSSGLRPVMLVQVKGVLQTVEG